MGDFTAILMLILMLLKLGNSLDCGKIPSGSTLHRCNLTLQSHSIEISPRLQTFELRKSRSGFSEDSAVNCDVISVGICTGKLQKRRGSVKELAYSMQMKSASSFRFTVRKRHRRIVKPSELFLILQCDQRICYVSQTNGQNPKNTGVENAIDIQAPQMLDIRRKLLSLRDSHKDALIHGHFHDSVTFMMVIACTGSVLVLVILLGLCGSCGDDNVDKALSNEVGGSGDEADLKVVAVSHVKVEESSTPSTPNEPKAPPTEKASQNGGLGERTESNASAHSSKNIHDSIDGGMMMKSSGSQSSLDVLPRASGTASSRTSDLQRGSGSVGNKNSELLRASGSSSSRHHELPRASGSTSSNKLESGEVQEKRLSRSSQLSTTSEDGRPSEIRLSKSVPVTVETGRSNIEKVGADQVDREKKRHSKSVISKLRHGSGQTKEKRKSNSEDEQKNKFWPRRKSSKNKKQEEEIPKHQPMELSDRPRVATPPTHHRGDHPRDLPLPPPPQASSSAPFPIRSDEPLEDDQYEVVEKRRATTIDSVTEYTSTRYDEVNIRGRAPSEMYDSVDENKGKRISGASDQYDVVEFVRPKLEPAPCDDDYAVVETQRKDVNKSMVHSQPDRTSTASDLYDIVLDDVKLSSAQDPNATYAEVQKTNKKRSGSREGANEYAEPGAGPGHGGTPIPQPPPLSSLITVADLGRRRASSGDMDSDSGSPPKVTPPEYSLGAPRKEYTYAEIDRSKKTRRSGGDSSGTSPEVTHPADQEFEFPEGFFEGSDTPPPIPPSIYAELEKQQVEASKMLAQKLKQSNYDYEEIRSKELTPSPQRHTSNTRVPSLGIPDYEEVVTVVEKSADSDMVIKRTSRGFSYEELAPGKNGDDNVGYYNETEASGPRVEPGESHLYDVVDNKRA